MLESHFSNKKKRTGEPSISAHQDVWSRLRDDVALKLRKSVVSLVLKNACRIPSIFSGIAIECHNNVTKFVTTGILARALQTGHFDEEIKVYCEGCVVKGYLDEYDSDRQFAVVKVMCALDVICVDLDHGMECKPRKQLIAVCRLFDTLHISSGEISYKSEDRAFLVFSPSFKNWLGAAFFDFGGKFVGMNHSHLLPSKITLERSKPGRVFRYVGMNGWYETIRGEHYFHPEAYDIFDKEQFRHLSALGYPIPSRSMVNRGFILVRTFENPFGDVYPKGVWGEFRKRVSSEISRNVVALASFKGETRIFACTGVFIDFDDKNPKILTSASLVRDPDDIYKTVEGLRIEVLLPSKQCGMGTLQHCSLHYNVAIVNVENYRSVCPMNLERGPVNHNSYMLKATTVVAVGRIFQSGALMAASGKLCAGSGILNCNALCYSTCKITKAGIGGPLVDFDGNFVGMNFHGMSHCCKKIGTPLLYREELCRILEFLKTNKTMKFSWGGSIIEDRAPINNWPVPAPYWCDPSDLEEDHMNDKRELEPDGRRVRYSCGSITMLK